MADVGKTWTKELADEELQKAIGLREENLARLNNTAADTRLDKQISAEDTRQTKGFTHAENLQAGGFKHAENLQAGSFEHSESLQRAQQNFQRSENEMQRNMTREQIARSERIAASNRATSMEIAKLGGTVQQDKDGNVIYIGKDGTAKAITDPNTGKPMVGFKDLTPAAKTYAEVIKAQLVDLDKQETGAAGDQAVLGKIAERRADLNNKLLNVLTGGIDQAAAKPASGASKAQWDNATGDVLVDGKKIGTAKTQDEAINIARNAGRAAPETAAKPAATSEQPKKEAYVPPAGTLAAEARDRKRGLIEKHQQEESGIAERVTALRDDFNVDQRHMTPQALAEKYGKDVDSLTDAQKALIFKARNQPAGSK